MVDTAPAFDPSQPFDVQSSGAAPKFDASKPFDVSQDSAAPAPDNGGIGKNIRAGFTEGLTGLASAITDPASKMLDAVMPLLSDNTAPEGSTASALGAGRKNTNPVPVGSPTHTLNQGLGLIGLNPEDVTASTTGERIARMAGTGATALLAPEAGGDAIAEEVAANAAPKLAAKVTGRAANSPVATVARKAVTGTSAGLGAGTAQEAVPDDDPVLKQMIGVLGGIAGGAAAEAPALARAVIPAAKRFIQPMTSAGQDQIAADTIRGRATNPDTLADTLDKPPATLVPGSNPTTFQQTGDMGLGSLERETAAKNPAPFVQRRVDQNAARQDALAGIQQDGNPDAVGTFLRGQFRNFDDQTQQHIDALTAQAQQQTEALGGSGVPEEHGAALRGALQDAENAAKTRERSLWQAVDPDNNIRIDAAPTFQAAQDIQDGMSRFAAPMDGPEQEIFDSLQGSTQLSLGELSDLRSRVSTAARNELTTSGASPAYARMIRLRGAIQNNLADAAANVATQDNAAVASGAMTPSETLSNKLQGWVNDYYGQRAAQSDATSGASGEGVGAGSVSGSARSVGTDGAGLPPEGGPASGEGDTGIPPRPIDEEDAARLAEATAATKARAGTFNQGPIKQTLAKAGMQDVYKLPEARVPEKFFHTGPTSASDIQNLRQTVGDQAALPILQDYAASSLRRAAENPDGTLDPRKVAAWQQKYAGPLRAFPDLNARFSTAADASDAIADAAASRREAIADRNSSALGKVMNAQTGDDVTKTVGTILGGKNAVQGMQDLAQAASRSPEATQGLRQAVADHIANRLISNTEAGTSGINLFKSDAFQSFVKNNRAALGTVFSPEELDTLDNIAADLKRANRSVTATKLPGGSNTAQDLHGIVANNPQSTVLDRALSEAAAAGAGAAVGHAAGAGLGWMGAKVANSVRAAGFKKVDDLITEAMLNPDLARDLLRRAPARPDSGQSIALASRLRRIALAAAATRLGGDERQIYSAGGHVHDAVHEADHEPTDAQIEAGNYRKGHVKLHGFDISVETPKGAARRGIGKDGEPWENRHDSAHYGYIKRTHGADGEHVDCYVGPHVKSTRIFIVNQIKPGTKRLDEHKVVMGARTLNEAKAIYDGGFSDGSGPKRRWSIREVTPEGLRDWLSKGSAKHPLLAAA